MRESGSNEEGINVPRCAPSFRNPYDCYPFVGHIVYESAYYDSMFSFSIISSAHNTTTTPFKSYHNNKGSNCSPMSKNYAFVIFHLE